MKDECLSDLLVVSVKNEKTNKINLNNATQIHFKILKIKNIY